MFQNAVGIQEYRLRSIFIAFEKNDNNLIDSGSCRYSPI